MTPAQRLVDDLAAAYMRAAQQGAGQWRGEDAQRASAFYLVGAIEQILMSTEEYYGVPLPTERARGVVQAIRVDVAARATRIGGGS